MPRKVLITYGSNPTRKTVCFLPDIDTANRKSDLQLCSEHMSKIIEQDSLTMGQLGCEKDGLTKLFYFYKFDADFDEEVEISEEDVLIDKEKVTLKLKRTGMLLYSFIFY